MRYRAAFVDDLIGDAGRVEQNPGFGSEGQRCHLSVLGEGFQIRQ